MIDRWKRELGFPPGNAESLLSASPNLINEITPHALNTL